MEPKGLVLRLRTDTVLSHSHQPPLTISVSSILNVAAFQDAAPVFCVALCKGHPHPVLDAFLFFSAEPVSHS